MIRSDEFRAACFRNAQDVVERSLQFDRVGDDETVIAVEACGICGTDISAILRGSEEYQPFGHEIAGRIVERDGALRSGRVVLESSSACGRCSACRNGHSDLCTAVTSFFARPYLGMAERMISPTTSVLEYEGLTPEVACLSEPLGVAIDLCETAGITPWSTVLVTGLGPIGLMAVRLAKLAGAGKIYASSYSAREKRNALALEFGADELIFEDVTPLGSRKLDPAPDRILSTVPPSFIGNCIPAAAPGAVIAYIGVGHGETDRVAFPANEFHFKKLQLRASYASPALRTPLALELLRSGRINGPALISHTFSLDDVSEAVRTACFEKDSAIKVVVTMDPAAHNRSFT